MTTRRWVTRGAAVLPLSGLLLVAAAPAALAAISGINEEERVHRNIQIVADYVTPTQDPPRLTLTEPGQPPVVVASMPVDVFPGRRGELRYTFNTRCWIPSTPSAPCPTTPQPARNGQWIAAQSGGAVESVPFTLSIPPDAPTGVTAAPASPQEMKISWRRGAEPDLTSYTVFEGDKAVRRGLAPKDVCNNDGACSSLVPVEGPGERTYTVVAFRSSGTPDPDLASVRSAPASGSLAGDPLGSPGAAPPPEVAGVNPSTSPSGSPSPTTNAAAEPGSRRDPKPPGAGGRRQAFSSGFNAFGPKLGIPKLPPLPESPEPSVALPDDGTFEPTLGYDDQVLTEEETELGADEQGVGVPRALGSLIDSEQLAKSTAGALVLLLTGAHLRRWLGATPPE